MAPTISGSNLKTVDWSRRDVGDFVRAVQGDFLHKGSLPSPEKVLALLDMLDSIVDRAAVLALAGSLVESYVLPFTAFFDTPGEVIVDAEIDKWRARSSEYREKISEANGSASKIFDDVTAPLITGYYPDGRDTYPDAASPIVIAHMTGVSVASLIEGVAKYYLDLAEETKRLAEGSKSAAVGVFKFLDWALDPERRYRLLVFPAAAATVGFGYVQVPRILGRVVEKIL